MYKKLSIAITSFLLVLIAGCIPYSDTPLTDPHKEPMDTALYGTWFWRDGNETGYVHIGLDKESRLVRVIMIASSAAWAQGHGNSDEIEFLYGFLEGPYYLIGRLPDSHKTYTGKVVLTRRDDHLEVIRRIEGKEIRGVGTIVTATPDKIKILRIRFTEENTSYEASYCIDSDLDNYGRLTGYLYLQEGGTRIPGLEALFIDHQTLEQQVLPHTAK